MLTMFNQSLGILPAVAPKKLQRTLRKSKSSASTAKELDIVLVIVLLLGQTSSLAATASKYQLNPFGGSDPLTVCRQSGHTAAECTKPRSAEGVECRKCNEGMFAFILPRRPVY